MSEWLRIDTDRSVSVWIGRPLLLMIGLLGIELLRIGLLGIGLSRIGLPKIGLLGLLSELSKEGMPK